MSLLELDEATFREQYNREPFVFRHRLAEHPLLQLPKLFELALRHPREEVLHWRGDIPVSADIDRAQESHGAGLRLQDAIANIAASGSYVLIRNAQLDPAYGALLEEILGEIEPLFRPLDSQMDDRVAYVFIAAPGSITPYHMDRDINFLFQLHGNKRVHVWDPRDREVLSETGLETLFAHYDAPRPPFKDEYQSRAQVFDLKPGLGVHQPFTAPHWVKNEDNVSASISATFRSHAARRKAGVHLVNHGLRRMGIEPTPYGASPARDSVKFAALRAYRFAKARLGQKPPARKGPYRA